MNVNDPPATPSRAENNVVMRKAKIDIEQLFAKETAENKELLNLVVIGHVDSGKSTLMGHLLYKLGSVSSKAMHKFETDSKKLGKASFAYAWVLDETAEERERGITMDVGQSKFETASKTIALLDAPGHKDFIPNMISGAYQADVAVLVVNAARGEFEAGFEAGSNSGQTREHALLARSLGVSQIAVAVNKLDTVNWSRTRFDEIVAKLSTFLRQVGFKEADVTYVPVSGFTGENLIDKSESLDWAKETLIEAIDRFKCPLRPVQKPFRMSVADVYKPQSLTGFCCAGRVESGFVQKDDRVLISPLNELATVRNILRDDEVIPRAFAGERAGLVLVGPADQASISSGMIICDPANPIATVKKFRARIVIFNVELPITKGFPVVLHYAGVQAQALIKRLIAVIDKATGEISKNRPRFLNKNCTAVVEISTETPVCLELYSDIKELGRFMLRVSGKTIAAGLVTDLL